MSDSAPRGAWENPQTAPPGMELPLPTLGPCLVGTGRRPPTGKGPCSTGDGSWGRKGQEARWAPSPRPRKVVCTGAARPGGGRVWVSPSWVHEHLTGSRGWFWVPSLWEHPGSRGPGSVSPGDPFVWILGHPRGGGGVPGSAVQKSGCRAPRRLWRRTPGPRAPGASRGLPHPDPGRHRVPGLRGARAPPAAAR